MLMGRSIGPIGSRGQPANAGNVAPCRSSGIEMLACLATVPKGEPPMRERTIVDHLQRRRGTDRAVQRAAEWEHGPVSTTIMPMETARLQSWIASSKSEYLDDLVRAGEPAEQASASVEQTFACYFPERDTW
jgi:hypothetical protein